MQDLQVEPFAIVADSMSGVIATAIHAGHQVRPEIAALLAVTPADRFREEDPFTDRIAATAASTRVVVRRSRFEIDLNRPRAEAIHGGGRETWGLKVWKQPPPAAVRARSREIHDAFYAALGKCLDQMAERGPFLLLDVHSYNHRRAVDGKPAPQAENPDINIGTGSMDPRWRPVIETLMASLASTLVDGRRIDVRENVKFRGRELARWVHERYPGIGCAPALEFKKTFMDERTGAVDANHVAILGRALKKSTSPALQTLQQLAS